MKVLLVSANTLKEPYPVYPLGLDYVSGAIAAKLEDAITGRVGPNFYQYRETSPWIMLVHHCHSFHAVDPLRYLQRTFFPEGFPAHPHRYVREKLPQLF